MSEGIVFPGDRVAWNEETIELDFEDRELVKLALFSLETSMNVESVIVEALKASIKRGIL
jgi:hypothetical protein